MLNIQMVDLKGQYQKIKSEIDSAVIEVCNSTTFINGPAVRNFEQALAHYLGAKNVIGCANGTDALQIALMALECKPGDEIVVPNFTYIATVEVAALLGLKVVLVDIEPDSFNIAPVAFEKAISPRTKAVVPVHLFGQCANMEKIMSIANAHNITVIEDNAQSIGAVYQFSNHNTQRAGTIGHIGTTSFYPSKNLSCFGDGGAIFTNDDDLAQQIRMIANHGQKDRYYFERVGVNSRLDSIQAAVLGVKLKYLNNYIENRQKAADYYDKALSSIQGIQIPARVSYSTHVFHQYTIQVKPEIRAELSAYLSEKQIPHSVFYPLCVHEQTAYRSPEWHDNQFPNAVHASRSVISLPMHTELTQNQLAYICESIDNFFRQR